MTPRSWIFAYAILRRISTAKTKNNVTLQQARHVSLASCSHFAVSRVAFCFAIASWYSWHTRQIKSQYEHCYINCLLYLIFLFIESVQQVRTLTAITSISQTQLPVG
jgi:hypothetical protein